MTTPKEVRDALVVALKSLKIAQGYVNNLPDANIKPSFDRMYLDNMQDTAYPKCLVFLTGGGDNSLIGEAREGRLEFILILVVKKVQSADNAQNMLMSYLSDLTLLLHRNHDLNGTVNSITIADYVMDGGILDPEGHLVMQLVTQRFG